MTLELRPSSKWWYGRFAVDGKSHFVNLGIKVQGRRPTSTQGPDGLFERSRGRALAAHDTYLADLKTKHNVEELTQRLIKHKTGSRVETVKISDLPKAWETLPHRRELSEGYIRSCKKTLDAFVTFMAQEYPQVSELYEVTQQMTRAFLKSVEDTGISAKTWNITLTRLRTVFRFLQPEAEAYRKHLVITPGKESTVIHRQPFTVEEIHGILEAAKGDPESLPGDCYCALHGHAERGLLPAQWKDVDLKNGFHHGQDRQDRRACGDTRFSRCLNEVLLAHPQGQPSMSFPKIAALYKKNSDAISTGV